MGEFPLMPPAASQYAQDIDLLFFALLGLTVLFTVLVFAMLAFLAIRYRRGSKVDRSRPSGHNTALEVAWSLGPLVLALGVFVWAAKLFTNVYAIPRDAKEIFVIGKQWMWHIQHANGIRENNELHVPVDEPFKLTMISQDVIHAFYVPEFRLQRHVEPGRYTSFWVKPSRVGKYHLYCNMYCGTQHSEMGGWVYVMSKPDYQKWTASGGSRPAAIGGYNTPTGGLTMAQQGADLFNRYQCVSCHQGEAVRRGRGPDLAGIYGKNRQLTNGKVVKADDGYLRNVVYYPQEYPLAGWTQGMPSYKGVLTEEEVLKINAYIKTLGTGESLGNVDNRPGGMDRANPGATPGGRSGVAPSVGGTEGRSIPNSTDAGNPSTNAPAANTDNQQWRYMYGGEQYN